MSSNISKYLNKFTLKQWKKKKMMIPNNVKNTLNKTKYK